MVARTLVLICLLILLFVPVSAAENDWKAKESSLDEGDVILFLAANALCNHAVANTEVIEAAISRLDNATPFNVRDFVIRQQNMMVELAESQPAGYVDSICRAGHHVAHEHGVD